LITSRLALDLWKDLFAVPWEIFKSNSIWCNNLIKNWEAKLITSSLDILEEYNFSNKNKTNNNSEKIKLEFSDELEEKIYNALLLESFTSDEMVKKFWLDISTLSFKLSMLEINWIIKKTLWWKFEVK
jgi:DNA processing protein